MPAASLRRFLGVLGWALAAAAWPQAAAQAQTATLPAMKFVTAALVSPAAAQAFYGSSTTHTDSLAGVPGFGAPPPEIVETARALKDNPDTIFDFVHNQVQTEYAFGERKGALGALIDRSGTPFDQNVLFVALVRQAGFPARYQIGPVTLTQAAFMAWTGVSDLGAACRMLSSGGVPASFAPVEPPANCQASGAFASVTILHVWSQVDIGGTWYAYDPSFKTYVGPPPVNLISASGFTPGAPAAAAATGLTSGTSGGAAFIKNASESSLGAYLTTVGTTLLNWLKTNAINPALDTDQVTGVTKIVQAYAPAGGWREATPPGYAVGSGLEVTGDIPDQYRTRFHVAMNVGAHGVVLDWPFYVDDIDGRRIGIATNFNTTGSASGGDINPAANFKDGARSPDQYTFGRVSLVVDDTVVQSWQCMIDYSSCFGGETSGWLTLTATHPYAAGPYADQTVVKQLTATAAPVAIVSGWGMVSPARLAKWTGEVAQDSTLPMHGTPPWKCDSEGGLCAQPNAQSAGDLTRQKLVASWLAQMTRMMQLQSTIAGATAEHQHSIGVADWRHEVNGYLAGQPLPGETFPDYYGIVDQFSDLNVDTVASITSKTDSAPAVAAISRSVALAAATLEGSVLEQMEDLPDAASTASRFAWGNNPGADNRPGDEEDPCWISPSNPRAFFDFTGTSAPTRGSLYEVEGSTTGCITAAPLDVPGWTPSTFTGAAENAISAYLAAGFRVTASAETFLGPGARFGPCEGDASQGRETCKLSAQRGDAVVATRFDGSANVLEVAHVLTSSTGISKGGGGKQPEHFIAYDPANAASVLKDRFVDRSMLLGVDLKSGTAGYSTPSLISVGAGAAPYKLDYALTYKAASTCTGTFGPCTGPVEGGWNHAWDLRLNNSGSGEEAMGATSPFEAAGTLVAFLAMQDIFAETGLANLNQDVFAALAADWWRQQMVANTVTINRGFTGQQYVRQVDGTWMPPIGSPGVLTQFGSRIKTRDDCHVFGGNAYSFSTSRRWVQSSVSFTLQNAGGDAVLLAPWAWEYDPNNDNVCAIVSGYKPTSWSWPQGVSLTFTYGTPQGDGTIDYSTGVTAIASSLGRTMTFSTGDGTQPTPLPTATTNGVTVGLQSATAIADAVSAPSGGASGHFWNFAYTAIQPRTATQRPVRYQQLYQVFNPVSAALPALQYGYDTRGLVKTAYDANALQLPADEGQAPYQWFLAVGGRGERDAPDGGAYTVWYDTDGDAVRNIDEIGRVTQSAWDGRHRVLQRIFPQSDQELFTYDGKDNVTSLTQVPTTGSTLAATVVTATYDPSWNHLASITDARGYTTTFAYYPALTNGASLMRTATRPQTGGVAPVYSFAYDAIGLPIRTVDPAGVTTAHGYDAFGNLTSTTEGASGGTNPQWGTTHWGAPAEWGAAALNLTTTFTPDAWGNVIATADPLDHVSNATFDLDRRPLLAIAPNPGTGVRTASRNTYDADGRVTQVDKGTTNATGANFAPLETTSTAFDPNGNKVQVSVLNGPFGSPPLTVTQISYDAVNRPVCTAERVGAGDFGSLPPSACAQSPEDGIGPDHITQLSYDLAGQKLLEQRGVGTPIQGRYAAYSYGLDGELLTILDANNNLTTNLYDGFIRLSKVEYPVKAIGAGLSDPADAESYTYDANGNRLTLTKRDLTTTIRFSYDPLNRMATKAFAPPFTAADVAYYYDGAGRPTGAAFSTVSGAPGVAWTYDPAGRRIGEATNGRKLTFAYDAASNPQTLTWPDGLAIAYAFDPANRLTLVGSAAANVTFGYDSLSRVNSMGRGPNSHSTIGYDNADRMTSLAHAFTPATANETWAFAFTPASQLQTVTSANPAWDWQAAPVDPIPTVANGLNQNATVASVPQTYDTFGNLTSDGGRTFAYDPENRLIAETGLVTMTIAYDPLGRLEQTVINGSTTQFLYDGDALVGEYPASGNTPLRRYVHGVGVDDPLIWYEGAAMTAANASYLIAGRQGSIVATADTAGAVTANYTYDPYGVPDAWHEFGSAPRFRYTGQAAIPEAHLYDYKARVYDPLSGKLLQTDPVGYGPDVNWYVYVGNDPLNASDPSGLDTVTLELGGEVTVGTGVRASLGLAFSFPGTRGGEFDLGVTGMFGAALGLKVDSGVTGNYSSGSVRDLTGIYGSANGTLFAGGLSVTRRLSEHSGETDVTQSLTGKPVARLGPEFGIGGSASVDVRGAVSVRSVAAALGINNAALNSKTGVLTGKVVRTDSKIPKTFSVCVDKLKCGGPK